MNRKTNILFLLVTFRAAGVVLMLIVGIELHMLSYRQKAAHIFGGSAPFSVLAFVVGLEGDIGYRMIGVNRERSFKRKFIAIAPVERRAAFPVEVRAVSVADQKSERHGKAKRYRGREATLERLIRSGYIPISGFQHQGSRL